MRFLTALAVVLSLLLTTATPVFADSINIAVLDMDKVRRDAKAVQSIRAQLGSYVDSFQAAAQKEDADLIAARDEVARKRSVLSQEAFAEERRKLDQRLADAQGKLQEQRRALERVHAEALQKVQVALNDIVTDIARDRDLTIVLRKDQTVYVGKGLEITDDVLKRLDKELPSVQISAPQ